MFSQGRKLMEALKASSSRIESKQQRSNKPLRTKPQPQKFAAKRKPNALPPSLTRAIRHKEGNNLNQISSQILESELVENQYHRSSPSPLLASSVSNTLGEPAITVVRSLPTVAAADKVKQWLFKSPLKDRNSKTSHGSRSPPKSKTGITQSATYKQLLQPTTVEKEASQHGSPFKASDENSKGPGTRNPSKSGLQESQSATFGRSPTSKQQPQATTGEKGASLHGSPFKSLDEKSKSPGTRKSPSASKKFSTVRKLLPPATGKAVSRIEFVFDGKTGIAATPKRLSEQNSRPSYMAGFEVSYRQGSPSKASDTNSMSPGTRNPPSSTKICPEVRKPSSATDGSPAHGQQLQPCIEDKGASLPGSPSKASNTNSMSPGTPNPSSSTKRCPEVRKPSSASDGSPAHGQQKQPCIEDKGASQPGSLHKASDGNPKSPGARNPPSFSKRFLTVQKPPSGATGKAASKIGSASKAQTRNSKSPTTPNGLNEKHSSSTFMAGFEVSSQLAYNTSSPEEIFPLLLDEVTPEQPMTDRHVAQARKELQSFLPNNQGDAVRKQLFSSNPEQSSFAEEVLVIPLDDPVDSSNIEVGELVYEDDVVADEATNSNTTRQKRKRTNTPSDSPPTKKRKLKPSAWKANQAKLANNSGVAHISLRGIEKPARKMKDGCDDKCRRKCSSRISPEARQKLFEKYWGLKEKLLQWYFLSKLTNSWS